jgi:transposase
MVYYTTDLREKALKYEKTHTVKGTSEVFGVSKRAIFEWKKLLRESGSLKPALLNRKYRKLDPEKLRKYVEEHPDAYQREMAREFKVSMSCIGKALKKLKITLKKRPGPIRSGMRSAVKSIRGSYPSTKKEDLVYVDESGIDQHLHRRNARSIKGKKVIGFVSGMKFRRTNIVAGYVNGRTIAECAYDGTTDNEVFNAWIEQALVPALRQGQIVIMDNASFHKHRRTRDAIEAAGCSLLFLPPYSPDFNPIEKFWANLKRKLSDILHLFSSLYDALQYALLK